MSTIGTEAIEGFNPSHETAQSARDRLRAGSVVVLLAALAGIPLVANDYWLNAVLIPFLIMSLTALGLNLLMGYAGQASLGSGGFMSVGAYATYNLLLRLPELPLPVSLLLGGIISGLVGVVAGLPSLRIKGASTSSHRRWRPSSCWNGCSINMAGSRTTRPRARSRRRGCRSSAMISRARPVAIS
nr:hypothetical protein [Bradyrhizobium brasilense]